MQKIPWFNLVTVSGIIGSLLFVALQIHENTKAVRGTTLQGITDQSLELNGLLMSVPELRSAYSKALQGRTKELTLVEEDELTYWYSSVLRVAENRFRQRELGTFTRDIAAAGGAAPAYRLPFFKAYWRQRRSTYPKDFALYVDRNLLPLVQDSLPRVLQR